MATIIKRTNPSGKVVYRVEYRIVGQPSLSKTFLTKKMAEDFVKVTDAKIIQNRQDAFLGVQRVPLFAEIVERYIHESFIGKGVETRKTEKPILNFWREKFGAMRITSITSHQISMVIQDLMDHKALSTSRRYAVILARVFNKSVEWGHLSKSPMEGMPKPSLPHGRERYLNQYEIDRLLEVCRYDRNENIHPMVVMALNTGARLGEVQRLRWCDIQGTTIVFRIRKGKRSHAVPMTPFLSQVLEEHLYCSSQGHSELLEHSNKLVFSNQIGSIQNIDHTWKRIKQKSGIEGLTFHCLRHSCASLLLQAGYPLALIKEVLGHSSIVSTMRYAHLEKKHIADALTTVFSEVHSQDLNEDINLDYYR